jgi:hypothetical protein
MLKIFRNTKKNATTAVIEDCELDAYRTVHKRLRNFMCHGCCDECCTGVDMVLDYETLRMPNKISGTVVCDARDTYDEKVGESEAVKKAMYNHKCSHTRAIIRWQVKALKAIKAVNPETFDKAVSKVK